MIVIFISNVRIMFNFLIYVLLITIFLALRSIIFSHNFGLTKSYKVLYLIHEKTHEPCPLLNSSRLNLCGTPWPRIFVIGPVLVMHACAVRYSDRTDIGTFPQPQRRFAHIHVDMLDPYQHPMNFNIYSQ